MNSSPDFECLAEEITLAVIAGGRGNRMGKPKAWLEIGGQPVLSWMLDRLRWPGPTMLVTAPAIEPPPDRECFDKHAIDPIDGLGPMRGVLTALEHASTSLTVAVAVDMPLIERRYLDWVVRAIQPRPEALGLMGIFNSAVEPFPAVYRASAAPCLSAQLAVGQRSLHRLCSDARFASVPVPQSWPAKMWTNLNDPMDMLAFETLTPGSMDI